LLLHGVWVRGIVGRETSLGTSAVYLDGQRFARHGFNPLAIARKSQWGVDRCSAIA
jgi:hypothetical protein